VLSTQSIKDLKIQTSEKNVRTRAEIGCHVVSNVRVVTTTDKPIALDPSWPSEFEPIQFIQKIFFFNFLPFQPKSFREKL